MNKPVPQEEGSIWHVEGCDPRMARCILDELGIASVIKDGTVSLVQSTKAAINSALDRGLTLVDQNGRMAERRAEI